MSTGFTDIAVVGAGPYGLSIAAHLKGAPLTYRIFGKPMDTWRAHMPRGMVLKSDGFASNLADPADKHTLEAYCKAKGIAYHPMIPPTLDEFVGYAMDFQEKVVPNVEPFDVVAVDEIEGGFRLTLENGETVQARRVVLSVGITHFDSLPEQLAHLPPHLACHASAHPDPGALAGKTAAVIGGGASAVELAVLMHEAGVNVHLVVRADSIRFFSGPPGAKRSLWQQIRHPKSGLGPGLRSRLLTDLPDIFRKLPVEKRWKVFNGHLGPASAFHLKQRIQGVPVHLGHVVQTAEEVDGKVRLTLKAKDGSEQVLVVDQVIAATGYPPKMDRVTFLNKKILDRIETAYDSPILSSTFETSVPGLYVCGLGSAMTFGPMFRFVFGARFAARRLSRHLKRVSR